MSFVDKIIFFKRKLPIILQTETTECGLACLCMISGYYGSNLNLGALRRNFSISLKGVSLSEILRIAEKINLGTRAVKAKLDDLTQLKLPCILHWEFNHFVVLKKVNRKSYHIHDPNFGHRIISADKFETSYTGVAVELWPNASFVLQEEKRPIRLRPLIGVVHGIGKSFAHIISLAIALEVFALISPFFLQWVIDDVIVSADRDLLVTLAIGFGILMLLQNSITAVRSWIIMYFGTTLNIQWRANIFTHLLRLPVDFFEKRNLGDIVSKFNAVDQIQRTLTTSFMEAILDGAMTLVTLSMMFLYSSKLAYVAIISMILYAIIRSFWYSPLRQATSEQIIYAAKQQSHFIETVRGAKSIKLFARQEQRRSTWLTLLVEQTNADLKTQKLQIFYKLVNGILFGLENILIIWLGASQVIDGDFSVGVFMAFNSYKGQFDSRVSSLIDKFFEVRMLQLYAERLSDIVHTDVETTNALLIDQDTVNLRSGIKILNLKFRYADGEPYILDGINLKIEQGESVAIVGPSGCGKTTLMNILLGVLPFSTGEIFIGGKNAREIGLEAIRKMSGTVLQDDVLFAGSIYENISFFDNEVDFLWAEECAKLAAVYFEITSMPMGFNTLVGDMGAAISGGQKQRILLARALYKKPKILFLDEATSHLDVEKERQVNISIKNLEITRIVIAHRPETIASADKVVFLKSGKIENSIINNSLNLGI